MEKVLLIISTNNLRQLYHELLVSSQIEVTPVDSPSKAVVFLAVDKFKAVILQEKDNHETRQFMGLMKRKKDWKKTKLFLVDDSRENVHKIVAKIVKEIQ